MNEQTLQERFGNPYLDLGVCALGKNLNLVSLRGFARLDALASISGPDTYNQFRNPEGTQRNLKSSHSVEAVQYALGSLDCSAEEDPRAFPELILNVRNSSLVEFYLPADGSIIDWHGPVSEGLIEAGIVGVRINLGVLKYPVPVFEPEISRVDGNHRLSAALLMLEAETDETLVFPVVPFALHMGLTKEQERKIFRDINGNHVGMQTAILDTFELGLAGEKAKDDVSMRPLWVAAQLNDEDMAFQDMVSMGGSTAEYREKYGVNPPLRINSLKSAVKVTIAASTSLNVTFQSQPQIVLQLVNAFWVAAKNILSEAFSNKKEYILLESIGLVSFSKLAGYLIDLAVHEGKSSPTFFEPYLYAIRDNVSLEKSANKGIAGAGGATTIYNKLVEAIAPEKIGAYKIQLEHDNKNPGIDEAFEPKD